jgi:hypothetical protein
MRYARFTVGRTFLGVLAGSMLVAAVLAAPTAAWASSGGCTQSSPCSLAFTADGKPAGTKVNTTITPSFNSPHAGAVKVQVLDASGQPVTNSKAAITIAITSKANPGSGTLSGTKTVSAIGGVASFSDLSIDKPGIGYRLTATSRGMFPVTSDHFDIWSSIEQCLTTPCSATASSDTTSGTVTVTETSPAGSPQFVAAGIGGDNNYSCAGTYQPVSDPFSFDVVSGSGGMGQGGQFTVALRIEKPTVQSSGHPGASTWQICYASSEFFSGSLPTTIGDVPYFTGLLPDCSNTAPVAPCVQARNKDNAGDVIVTFLASGDPFGKG